MGEEVYLPCVAHTYTVIYIAENELQDLVGENTRGICKPKERVIGKHSPQPHRSSMQNPLMTQTTQTAMTMNNFNLLTNENVSQNREEGKHRGECSLAVDDKKRHMVYFKSIGEISHALSVVVRVCNDDDLVAAVNELAGELVDVRFDASWLREEEVAKHSDIVPPTRHVGGVMRGCEAGVRGESIATWPSYVVDAVKVQVVEWLSCLSHGKTSMSLIKGPDPLWCETRACRWGALRL